MKRLVKLDGYKRRIRIDEDKFVTVGGINYRIDSDKIVRVRTRNGNSYYLKDSPFLVRNIDMVRGNITYYIKNDCVYLYDVNKYVLKTSDVYAQAEDGKYYHKDSLVNINNQFYFLESPKIFRDYLTGEYCVKDGTEFPLSKVIYGVGYYTKAKGIRLVKLEDEDAFAMETDSIRGIDKDRNIRFFSSKIKCIKDPQAFVGFIGEAVDFKKLKRGFVLTSDLDYFKLHPRLNKLIHESEYDEIDKAYSEWYTMKFSSAIKERIKLANNRYSEVGPDENNPSELNLELSVAGIMGGNVLKDYRDDIISNFARKLGGLRYSFGVEIETSNGGMYEYDIERTKVAMITDGSITGPEFATSVLHGDKGVKNLKEVVDAIHKSSLVNDKCGVHVHIGGLKDSRVWNPSFNRFFSFLAVKLGIQIEDELYRMMPESRKPNYKHCKSIKEYKDISLSNWKTLLGDYIFEHRIDESHNSKTSLGKWTPGRYKWLNIVNCGSNSDIRTIEFRIFGGTLSFEKILNYVRISMAFVWFVENRQKRIMEGNVTLREVIESAFFRDKQMARDVMSFIEERKLRFNRKDI